MSRHTFPLPSRRRLIICPDKFSPGSIRLEIQSADRNIMGSVTLDGPTLAVVCQAMELEALAALSLDARKQALHAVFSAPDAMACDCGVADGDRPCQCAGWRVERGFSAADVRIMREREVDRRVEKARLEDAMLIYSLEAAETKSREAARACGVAS